MIRPLSFLASALLCVASRAQGQAAQDTRPPIIDMHLHAMAAAAFGPPPIPVCAARVIFSPRPPGVRTTLANLTECETPILSPTTDDALMERTLAIMRRYNITGVVSGPIGFVRRWKAAAPERLISSVGQYPLDSIERWAGDGTIRVLGEVTFQLAGLSPSDSVPQAYFALAERLDLPVGFHMGLGPPGLPTYRMRLSDPLLLEDVLVRHPKLRLYVMHAGWPMADAMVGLLYAYPHVYVDIGVIDWFIPRAEFHAYLKRLVDAGFEKRIMFGSDQMIWPEAIESAIDAIESAPFLTAAQKRDIFYNNAARFLRLEDGRSPQ